MWKDTRRKWRRIGWGSSGAFVKSERIYLLLLVLIIATPMTEVIAATNSTASTNSIAATNNPATTNAAPLRHGDHSEISEWVCVVSLIYLVVGLIGILLYARSQMNEPLHLNDELRYLRRSNLFFLPVFHIGISSVLLYFCCRPLGTVLMWIVAWFSIGTVIGFIFSVPKASREESVPTAPRSDSSTPREAPLYETNNNLVEVSDWLTKIVIGLGLINLKDAPGYLWRAANTLKPCLGEDCYLPLGISLILGFTSVGFLFGYVFTRLFLARAFSLTDLSSREARKAEHRDDKKTSHIVEKVTGDSAKPPETIAGTAATPALPAAVQKPPKERFADLAAAYERDQIPDRADRIRWKDEQADAMAAVLAGSNVAKRDIADFVAASPSDGAIAGLATYVIARAEPGDMALLLRIAALARRLHTRYRLLLAFRQLLRNRFVNRTQADQLRVLLEGWIADADEDLRASIQSIRALLEREFPPNQRWESQA
jgi:hypothetical protein